MQLKAQLNLEALLKEILADSNQLNDISVYFEELDDTSHERNIKNAVIWNEAKVYYPASLLKLYVAVMAEHELHKEDSALVQNTRTNDEAIRAIEESIVVSDNDALGYLIDLVTDTVSGLELDDSKLSEFHNKRKQITEFFEQKAYSKDLKLANKCFSFDRYGRDKQLYELEQNSCTVIDVANIIKEIRSKNPQIYKFLKRDLTNVNDYQTKFIGAGIKNYLANIKKSNEEEIKGCSFYSKAGWMSKVRHDAAVIDGKYLLIILTENMSNDANLIPKIACKIAQSVSL